MIKELKDTKDTLLTFPCDFTLKVFGLDQSDFEKSVFTIIQKHVPNLSDKAFQSRKNGKYSALTITVHVDTKEQLDQIYRDLSSSPHVVMTL